MIKLNAIKIKIVTPDGLYGFEQSFQKGLNIIRGNNSSGKSSLFQAILYALGLEELLGGKNEKTMQSVLKDQVEFPDSDFHKILQSEVYLEIENNDTSCNLIINNNASITGALAMSGPLTILNNAIISGNLTIDGDILPDSNGLRCGTTDQPWSDVITWNVATEEITSAFGGMTISNGTSKIELVQNDNINLSGTKIHLGCEALTLSTDNYGYELPATVVEGQVFFLLLEE